MIDNQKLTTKKNTQVETLDRIVKLVGTQKISLLVQQIKSQNAADNQINCDDIVQDTGEKQDQYSCDQCHNWRQIKIHKSSCIIFKYTGHG